MASYTETAAVYVSAIMALGSSGRTFIRARNSPEKKQLSEAQHFPPYGLRRDPPVKAYYFLLFCLDTQWLKRSALFTYFEGGDATDDYAEYIVMDNCCLWKISPARKAGLYEVGMDRGVEGYGAIQRE